MAEKWKFILAVLLGVVLGLSLANFILLLVEVMYNG